MPVAEPFGALGLLGLRVHAVTGLRSVWIVGLSIKGLGFSVVCLGSSGV